MDWSERQLNELNEGQGYNGPTSLLEEPFSTYFLASRKTTVSLLREPKNV